MSRICERLTSTLRGACLATVSAVLALAACSQPTSETPAADTMAAPAGTVAAAPVMPATSTALPADHATTARYRIAIDLPTFRDHEAHLAEALRRTADQAKREFLKALPDPKQFPEFADRQLQLLLDFSIAAQDSRFTSVRETGMVDTGGAHPIPVEATFVFDRQRGTLIALDDLFGNPDEARKVLAAFVRPRLREKFMANAPGPAEGSSTAIREWRVNTLQMLEQGTKPTRVNYSLFVVRAGATADASSPGLTLVFPPYQVAPYVAGTQLVEVPAAIFRKLLKPAYRGAFATR